MEIEDVHDTVPDKKAAGSGEWRGGSGEQRAAREEVKRRVASGEQRVARGERRSRTAKDERRFLRGLVLSIRISYSIVGSLAQLNVATLA
jgi:hypothetical protein